eukprot:scaffold7808_cov184-Amphora_coffeaeformis.AAC.15
MRGVIKFPNLSLSHAVYKRPDRVVVAFETVPAQHGGVAANALSWRYSMAVKANWRLATHSQAWRSLLFDCLG